jgi:hypothetical protein
VAVVTDRSAIANALMTMPFGYSLSDGADHNALLGMSMTPLPDEELAMYPQRPKQAELRAGSERAWPSTAFYENLGMMPSTIDRYGQAQTALYSGVNNALLGVPHALMERFAPETAGTIDGIRGNHGVANKAAAAAGFIASPASRVFRAAGDAVRARGGGIAAQAGADAATAGAVTALPTAIAGNGLDSSTDNAAAAAAGYRMLSPHVAPGLLARTALGATGGLAMSGGAVIGLRPGEIIENMATGGLMGAASRTGGKPDQRLGFEVRDDAQDALMRAGLFSGMPVMANGLLNMMTAQDGERPAPSMDAPGYGDRPSDYWRLQMARALQQ